MDLTFKLGDIVIVLAVLLGAAACGYIVLILSRVAATIKNVNAMLEANRSNIDATMKSLPGILENVNEISGSVRQKTEMIDNLFSGGGSGDASEASDNSSVISVIQTAISSITSIIEVFNEIKNFFTPKKKIFKIRKK
jgi:uncharacterized protein YoxC